MWPSGGGRLAWERARRSNSSIVADHAVAQEWTRLELVASEVMLLPVYTYPAPHEWSNPAYSKWSTVLFITVIADIPRGYRVSN
jgi:hypothetical protein